MNDVPPITFPSLPQERQSCRHYDNLVPSRGFLNVCLQLGLTWTWMIAQALSQTSHIHSHALKRSRRRCRMKGSVLDFSWLALSVALSLKKAAVSSPPDLLQIWNCSSVVVMTSNGFSVLKLLKLFSIPLPTTFLDGLPKLYSRYWKNIAWSDHSGYRLTIKLGINNMKAWIHPALCQRFRLVVMGWCGDTFLVSLRPLCTKWSFKLHSLPKYCHWPIPSWLKGMHLPMAPSSKIMDDFTKLKSSQTLLWDAL